MKDCPVAFVDSNAGASFRHMIYEVPAHCLLFQRQSVVVALLERVVDMVSRGPYV